MRIPDSRLQARNFPSLGGMSFGSALGGIGSSVAGGLFGGLISGIQARKQRKFQREMLQRQQDFAREMWQKQADYNSPVNQRKMLEEAGYNPQLMNSGQAGFAASSAPSPSVAGTYQPMNVGEALSGVGSSITSALTAKRGQNIDFFSELMKALNQSESIRNQNARWQVQSSIENQLKTLSFDQFEIQATEAQARIGKMAAEAAFIEMQKKAIPYNVANQTAQVITEMLNGVSYRSLNNHKIQTEKEYQGFLRSQTTGQDIMNILNGRNVPEAQAAVQYWKDHPAELDNYISKIIDMPYYNMFWQNFHNFGNGLGDILDAFGGLLTKKGKGSPSGSPTKVIINNSSQR